MFIVVGMKSTNGGSDPPSPHPFAHETDVVLLLVAFVAVDEAVMDRVFVDRAKKCL